MLCSRNTLALMLSALIAVGLAGCALHLGGRSCAVTTPVRDGQIVLLKKGKALGAFIPRNQKMTPEALDYQYYYRIDGQGTFRSGGTGAYWSGTGSQSQYDQKGRPFRGIDFGPFSIGWSGEEDGKGWLYYDHFDGDKIVADDLRICITSETDIKKIDASDSKWLYKATPSDRGVRVSKPAKNAKP